MEKLHYQKGTKSFMHHSDNKYTSFLFILFIVFTAQFSFAQLSGTVNVGTGETYTTLTANGGLFQAINANGLNGNLTVNITSNTTENGVHALNQWAGTHTLRIQVGGTPPTAGWVLAGNVSGDAAFRFNGADRVTVDGNRGGNRALTFRNSNNSRNTIQLLNGATQNTFSNCIIEGSSTNNTAGRRGVISFFTSTASEGNNHNLIENCEITKAGTNRPFIGIASDGTADVPNTNNIIRNNLIYEFVMNNATVRNGFGIGLFDGTSAWTIQENSFYFTTNQITGSGNTTVNGIIWIANSGTDYLVEGNYIGGSAPQAGGTAMNFVENCASCFFRVQGFIHLNNASGTLRNNRIENIYFRGQASGTGCGSDYAFRGINVQGTGNVIIEDNLVQNITVENIGVEFRAYQAIGINFTAAQGEVRRNEVRQIITNNPLYRNKAIEIVGMWIQSGGTANIYENHIHSLINDNHQAFNTCSFGGSTRGASITAMVNASSSDNVTIYDNIIENITTPCETLIGFSNSGIGTIRNNAIRNLSHTHTEARATLSGFFSTGNALITDNDIYNFSSLSTLPSNADSVTIAGLHARGGTAQNFAGNRIYNLRSETTGTAQGTTVAALFLSGNANGQFYNNQIYGLSTSSEGTLPVTAGVIVRNAGASLTVHHNMISLGLQADGSNEARQMYFLGIWQNLNDTDNPQIYFNSVVISGNTVTGTLPSYSFYRGDFKGSLIETPLTIQNNIFQNSRTGGGTHYAIGNETSSSNWSAPTGCATDKTIDYNAFFTLSLSGTIGNWLGTNQTFATWQATSQADDHSILIETATPLAFTDLSTADLHVPDDELRINAKGIPVLALQYDIDGDFRRGPDIGADEVQNTLVALPAGGNWNDQSIWDLDRVPTHADIVIIGVNQVQIEDGAYGHFFQMEIQATGRLEVQGNAQLYGAWFDGDLENNGTLTFTQNGNLHIAGNLIDNANFQAGNSTTFMNVDVVGDLECTLTQYIASFNDNTTVSDIGGTANTVFENLTILNDGLTALQNNNRLVQIEGVMDIQGAGQIIIQENTLQLNGTISPIATGTLTGSPFSNLSVAGSNGGSLEGLLRFTAGARELRNLTMNRQGENASATLGTPLSIYNVLSMELGILRTDALNLLTLTENAESFNASDLSHVEGPMAKMTNSTNTFTFPVGRNGHLGSISITPTTTSPSTFVASYFQGNPVAVTGSNLDLSLANISTLEYWNLAQISGSTQAFVGLHYTAYSAVSPDPAIRQDLRVAQFEPFTWENRGDGNGGIGSATQGVINSFALNSFGFFTIGSESIGNPLPLTITDWKAVSYQNQKVQLSWKAHQEEEGITYHIVKIDAQGTRTRWAEVAQQGSTQAIKLYQVTDDAPQQGWNYYQLEATKANGITLTTQVVGVYLNTQTIKISVYPNPTTDELNIRPAQHLISTINLYDGNAHLQRTLGLERNPSSETQKISVKDLPQGIYLLEVISNQGREIHRILKR